MSYHDPELKQYLESFYEPQGGVQFSYLEDQDYVLSECLKCTLIYQKEIPNPFLMKKLYEEWIDPEKTFACHEARRPVEYYARLSSEIIEVIKWYGRNPSELHFLDFGMGWGHWCRLAGAFGCVVHGCELSSSRIAYAKRNGVHVIDHDDIKKHKYDFINTQQVFEHVSDIVGTLSGLGEALEKTGVIKISVPNAPDIKERLRIWNWLAPKGSPESLNAVAPLEHINTFNAQSLALLASRCGLKTIHRASYGTCMFFQPLESADRARDESLALVGPHPAKAEAQMVDEVFKRIGEERLLNYMSPRDILRHLVRRGYQAFRRL